MHLLFISKQIIFKLRREIIINIIVYFINKKNTKILGISAFFTYDYQKGNNTCEAIRNANEQANALFQNMLFVFGSSVSLINNFRVIWRAKIRECNQDLIKWIKASNFNFKIKLDMLLNWHFTNVANILGCIKIAVKFHF